jgi:hypothetical protein
MRDSGLTPALGIFDSRQQQFAGRLANACSSKLYELHQNPAAGALMCGVVLTGHEHGSTIKAGFKSAWPIDQWSDPPYWTT